MEDDTNVMSVKDVDSIVMEAVCEINNQKDGGPWDLCGLEAGEALSLVNVQEVLWKHVDVTEEGVQDDGLNMCLEDVFVDQEQGTIAELLTNEGLDIEKREILKFQVCSNTKSKGVSDHFAKEKYSISDSDVHQEIKVKEKVSKIKGSTRVISRPARLNL